MYQVTKRLEVAGAHSLTLPYKSKCTNLHGHNWIITVICQCADTALTNGMVIDFAYIKLAVMALDHTNLNGLVSQPTAEALAKFIADSIEHCTLVRVQESEDNEACYMKPTHVCL